MAKKKTTSLYLTALWRDNHQCVNCGSSKNVAVYVIDPTFAPSLTNLETLCVPCICIKRNLKLKIYDPPASLISELRRNGISDTLIAENYLGSTRQRLYQIMEEYTEAKKILNIA